MNIFIIQHSLKASHGRATDDEVLKRLGPLLDQLEDFSKVRIKVEREKRHSALDEEEINQADPTSEACDQPNMSVSQ